MEGEDERQVDETDVGIAKQFAECVNTRSEDFV
jgi:hypothetical protein